MYFIILKSLKEQHCPNFIRYNFVGCVMILQFVIFIQDHTLVLFINLSIAYFRTLPRRKQEALKPSATKQSFRKRLWVSRWVFIGIYPIPIENEVIRRSLFKNRKEFCRSSAGTSPKATRAAPLGRNK